VGWIVRWGLVIASWAAALLAVSPTLADTPAAPASVTSYAPTFFAALKPETAFDMVNALPGFALDTGQQVRGFVDAAGNVLIDGDRPATKNDTLDEILKRIPASAVERIDLVRGGAPGIDMQGKTVVANVIRKGGRGRSLVVGAQGSVAYNGHFDYGLRLEGSDHIGPATVEASLLVGTGPDDGTGVGPHTLRDAAGQVIESDHEDYFGDAGNYKAQAAVQTPALGGTLRFESSFLAQPYTSNNEDVSPLAADRQDEIYDQDQDTGEVGLRFQRAFGPRLGLELYALEQVSNFSEYDNLNDAGDDEIFALKKDQGESIVRGIVTVAPGPGLQIRAGLEGDDNRMRSHTVETDEGAPILVPAADVVVTELRGEAFADVTWTATPKLTLESGLRVEASRLASSGDVVSDQAFVFPKPRAVATFSPDSQDQLQLRAEREVTQLDFAYFAASGTLGQGEHAGNPAIVPQQDWVIEGSYDRRFLAGADANITLRQYWLQDVIDWAPFCAAAMPTTVSACNPADLYDAPANIGSGWRREIAASLTLPTDRLFLKHGQLILRSTWRLSQVRDPSTGLPREISGVHPVDAEGHFTEGLPWLSSSWGADFFAAWRQTEYLYDEIDTQRLGDWVDVWFEYRPKPGLSIKLEGDNLASHGLEQIRAFYEPYRNEAGSELFETDSRNPRFGPEVALRVRKTFG